MNSCVVYEYECVLSHLSSPHLPPSHPFSPCGLVALQGVPVRIEIGPRDVTAGTVVTARRDMPGKPGKQFGVPMAEEALLPHVSSLLDAVQEGMLAAAVAFRDRCVF